MKTHTQDFLESLLFVSDSPDHEKRPLEGKTIHDFHPDFVQAVDRFISLFESYLEKQGFDMGRIEELQRSFGGNVFFSLSGHGCGFWEEYQNCGKELQAHLEAFSGSKYRFEHMNLSTHRGGKIDLSFLVKFLPEQRGKMFFNGLAE